MFIYRNGSFQKYIKHILDPAVLVWTQSPGRDYYLLYIFPSFDQEWYLTQELRGYSDSVAAFSQAVVYWLSGGDWISMFADSSSS